MRRSGSRQDGIARTGVAVIGIRRSAASLRRRTAARRAFLDQGVIEITKAGALPHRQRRDRGRQGQPGGARGGAFAVLKPIRRSRLKIRGHTDDRGDATKNKALGTEPAAVTWRGSVREGGSRRQKLSSEGVSRPLEPSCDAGRAANPADRGTGERDICLDRHTFCFACLRRAPRLRGRRAGNHSAADDPHAETVRPTPPTGKTEVARAASRERLPAAEDPARRRPPSRQTGSSPPATRGRSRAHRTAGNSGSRRDEHQFSAAASAELPRAGKSARRVGLTVRNYLGPRALRLLHPQTVALFLNRPPARSVQRFRPPPRKLRSGRPALLHQHEETVAPRRARQPQHDIRRDASRRFPAITEEEEGMKTPPPTFLDKTQTLHNVRTFLGIREQALRGRRLRHELRVPRRNVSDLGTYRLIFDIGAEDEHLRPTSRSPTCTIL